MGKGYNNYMCKKPFHPGSKANIKRAWMAEQKTENEKRKQDELKVQYEKEQDLYNNRALISSESKDKLELNFMYEAPPGAKRERQKEDDEPEYRFEWQRKYNAPREDYAKGNADIRDQPFGIPVRNVRCIKCHKWGHINTDRECPLYSQASSSSMPTTSMDPLELMRQMKEDGYGLKENVLGHHVNPLATNQQFIPSDESDPETEFLKSLSTADKKKLLKKLKRLSKKQEKSSKHKKKSKKTHKSKKWSSDSDSESGKRKKKRKKSSSSSSDSSSEDSEKDKHKTKKRRQLVSSKESKSKRSRSSSPVREREFDKPKLESHHKSKHSKSTVRGNEPKAASSSKQMAQQEKEHKLQAKKHATDSDYLNLKIKKEPSSSHTRPVHSCTQDSSSSDGSESEGTGNKKSDKKRRKPSDLSGSPLGVSSLDKIKVEKINSVEGHPKVGPQTAKDSDPEHPDGFSHLCPQATIDVSNASSESQYKGLIHDKFRLLHRDERSPSVKHKYNT